MAISDQLEKAARLRRQAEEKVGHLAPGAASEPALPPEGSPGMLHDLRVHQIELELQNEELRRALAELDASQARYFELYDLAPVGYLTVSEKGLILQANLTAAKLWNVERGVVVRQPLSRFIFKEDQDIFYLHRKALFDTGEPQSFELRMMNTDHAIFWAGFGAVTATEADGELVCRVTMQDITARKQAEGEVQRQLAEKENILREVNHRIKNNIASVESLLSLQACSIESPEGKAALQDSISRIQSIRILYEKLLLTDDYDYISFKSYVEGLIEAITTVFAMTDNVTVERKIDDFRIAPKIAIPIGIIINELLTNVYKYAFTGRSRGAVSISIDKAGNTVTLIISDNGIGSRETSASCRSPGLGLSIVKGLIEQLNGTFKVKNDDGTTSVVQFEV